MREISSTAMQAILAQNTAEVFVPWLKIDHPDFVNPIRLAMNTEALTKTDGSYLPYAFQITLPEQREDQIPQVTLTVDNTDLDVNNAIRTLVGQPTVTMGVALASSPNTDEIGPIEYSLQSATADANTIQGVLGFEDDIFAQQVPAQLYTPVSSPGLFR